MNLIDKLLCVDKAKIEEKETKKIKSKKLELFQMLIKLYSQRRKPQRNPRIRQKKHKY